MNFVIAGIVVILIMLCAVAGFKIIREDISGIYGVLDKLLEIEKDFDSNITKGTSELVDVCKNHLCAVQTKCEYTNLKVEAMGKDLETFSEQLSAITDHIREKSVERDPFFDQESLCDSCKYDDPNLCVFRSERALCNYEPKNAFEQAGEV